ncbi:molybdenum cofactor guanylyltransferase [Alcanivorax sp. DP30]|uniref:molybdenum cofactor guanylyltransferase n=1 Tax=Alcanivorax sp. DP30 TaxID=2606217 RepID=UPI00136E8279|nr:molybdenum cofactor guanylyltransferase [Alcanivorax sp. DP30]MZR61967.1 NTP transferase domain-containing protein [Alcanivorax sp. DP30]
MNDYTLIILAGGKGSRMGGADKGLTELDGKALVAHLLDHLHPRPARIVISANRNQTTYRHWADRVIEDQRPGFPGPMAGLEAALSVSSGLCVCLPCDLVQPPSTLVTDLLHKSSPEHITVARDPIRRQPLCLALHAESWLASLTNYLDNKGRSAYGWLEQTTVQEVAVATPIQNLNHAEH